MPTHSARRRVLYRCLFTLLCLLALSGTAAADDGTTTPPRTAPLARAIPRSFATYDALIAFAGGVASDDVALHAQLLTARSEGDLARTVLATIVDPRLRGGLIRAEENVNDGPSLGALRGAIVTAGASEARLVAAGATVTTPAPTWRRPLSGDISQPFGPTWLGLEPARTYQGTRYLHFHEGVDIVAGGGNAIVAPARGRVVFAGRMGDGAEVVVLAHDNGLVSLYAHLERGSLAPTIAAGDLVQAGDRLGSVGLTGITTGYHLHWAVYKNGEPIDPLGTLGP
jgi:murein DD-endopeptidase MepM/ murein hydrolase activator NlpD